MRISFCFFCFGLWGASVAGAATINTNSGCGVGTTYGVPVSTEIEGVSGTTMCAVGQAPNFAQTNAFVSGTPKAPNVFEFSLGASASSQNTGTSNSTAGAQASIYTILGTTGSLRPGFVKLIGSSSSYVTDTTLDGSSSYFALDGIHGQCFDNSCTPPPTNTLEPITLGIPLYFSASSFASVYTQLDPHGPGTSIPQASGSGISYDLEFFESDGSTTVAVSELAIPEPASWSLIAAAAGTITLVARRRRRG